MISKTAEKLQDPEYRRAFVASQINIGIPFQIRALLRARGRTQEWLAKKTGMLQPRISALITPGKTRPNIETLRRLAEAFDCGLTIRFLPFSELVRWSDTFDPERFYVPEFADDSGLIERRPSARHTSSAEVIVEPQVAAANNSLAVTSAMAPPVSTVSLGRLADNVIPISRTRQGTRTYA